jgi:hypothetical protein
MTTSTATLADFLRERLAEDEALALAATPGPWEAAPYLDYPAGVLQQVAPLESRGLFDAADDFGTHADAAHIARQDPARVLATVAAHRAIVEQAIWEREHLSSAPEDPEEQRSLASLEWACRQLATIYADRDGFDPAWVAS